MSLLRKIGEVGQQHGTGAIGARDTTGRRTTLPAPTKGLNTRDAFASMNPEYATALDNYFPDHGAVRLRRGSSLYVATTGATEYVLTLFPHYSSEVSKFFAINNGILWDITDPTDIANTTFGLQGSRWNHTTLNGHTILVNGLDEPLRIQSDGTLADPHGLTNGVDSNAALPAFSNVFAYKNRVFFVEKDSQSIWYSGIASIAGELNKFDLVFVAPEGGKVITIGDMTIDAGSGIDDLFLVFLEHGVVLVYSGIDPAASDATGFRLVGKFKIGSLVGDRPLVNVGGDLFAHTVDGIASMSELLQRGRSGQTRVTLSDAIAPTIREQAEFYSSIEGWDSILHPPASWLLFNSPNPSGEQFVMNTQTGAWCRFRGWDARCFARWEDRLFYGGNDGRIVEVNVEGDDAGSAIDGDVQTAFNYLGTPQDKRITMGRSVVEADRSVAIQLGATVDFGERAQLNTPTELELQGDAIWGKATWDVTPWNPGVVHLRSWHAINRVGAAVSVRLKTRTSAAQVSLYATDIIYERAPGIL